MSSTLGIDHSVSSLKESCQQDISKVQAEVYDYERKLEEVNKIAGVSKLIHISQIRKRREYLESEIAKLKKKVAELRQEMEMYNRYGKDIPKDAPNYEQLANMLDNRIYKLEIVLMIDLGMM